MSRGCKYPFSCLYIENVVESSVSPCCLIKPQEIGNCKDLFNHPFNQKIRDQFNQGIEPDECNFCWEQEELGMPSRRQVASFESVDNKLTHLEINVGNYCNLRCRICGPKFSSSWAKEGKELGLHKKDTTYQHNKIWKDYVDFTNVKWVHFNGGEPLLTNTHVEILEKIPNKKNTRVMYNTNGTVLVSLEVFELWKEFDLVTLSFSIDDVEQRFEYQRYPAKWNDVVDNMMYYRDFSPVNTIFEINRVISKYNNKYLTELDKWVNDNFSTNRLGDPVKIVNQPAVGIASLATSEQKFNEYNVKLDSIRYK